MPDSYYVYIITNRPNGTLYVGMTNNIARRMFEHKSKAIEGFSKKYDLNLLAYYEVYPDPESAIVAEKRMKEWKRAWKVGRILSTNPDWKDLSLTLNN